MNDKIMVKRDIVIIGGGPAGLAAALAAKKEGAESILILERDKELGGILNQCIHNGFGLHTFQEELTGPEYAARFIRMVKEQQIEYRLNTMVMDISQDKVITAMSRQEGMYQIRAKAVILAMGCRERPRGALNIPGYRPAGIYSAGTAQRLVNMEGFMPGKKVVILGSGDIGLIMARRMTLEGAEVKAVAELMPYSGGLKRNIVQCLDDFGIPLKLSHTVVDIKGKELLRTLGKYYIVDIGLRNYLLGYRNRDSGHILENVIFLELMRRGYDVAIGKIDKLEIDFIATKADEKLYIQVTESMLNEDVRKRELAPLQKIRDNYRKLILSLDPGLENSFDGIESQNIIDWLLETN